MKQLILVRHAKTQPLTNSISDFGRKLLPRGIADSRLVANHLKENHIRPDLIISSPALRALETARLFADVYGIRPNQIVEAPIIYEGFTVQSLTEKLNRIASNMNRVMIVGHNPDIYSAAIRLSRDDFSYFPTTAVAVLDCSVDKWSEIIRHKSKLTLFVTPKQLKDS